MKWVHKKMQQKYKLKEHFLSFHKKWDIENFTLVFAFEQKNETKETNLISLLSFRLRVA